MPKRETREMREKKVKPLITQNIKAGTRKNTYKILHMGICMLHWYSAKMADEELIQG